MEASTDAGLYDELGDPARLDARPLFVTGGRFVLDAPDTVPAIWGEGDRVLWAEGESLVIAGPPGVGKTTLSGQVLRGRLIGETVLGLPVQPTAKRVLYLAMDRPRQIARAIRRTLGDLERDLLDDRLVVWQGPPPVDVARHPEVLVGLAVTADADTVFVDALKDAAVGLSDDDVGAGYNRARQMLLAAGVELVENHHTVKRGANGGKPTSLADLYGSTWIASGAGSVVLLHGDAGDPVVELRHLKQPAAEVGPWKVQHDHEAGRSTIVGEVDLAAIACQRPGGITAKEAAVVLFGTDKPTTSQVEKARRRLKRLARDGHLIEDPGDDATRVPSRWRPALDLDAQAPSRHPSRVASGRDPRTTPSQPSRPQENPQLSTLMDTLTTLTRTDPHARPRPYKDGAASPEADDRPTCPNCGAHLGAAESQDGQCLRCHRIAQANEEAAP